MCGSHDSNQLGSLTTSYFKVAATDSFVFAIKIIHQTICNEKEICAYYDAVMLYGCVICATHDAQGNCYG